MQGLMLRDGRLTARWLRVEWLWQERLPLLKDVLLEIGGEANARRWLARKFHLAEFAIQKEIKTREESTSLRSRWIPFDLLRTSIGGHLVKKLKRAGYWVRGVDIKDHEFAPTQSSCCWICGKRTTVGKRSTWGTGRRSIKCTVGGRYGWDGIHQRMSFIRLCRSG